MKGRTVKCRKRDERSPDGLMVAFAYSRRGAHVGGAIIFGSTLSRWQTFSITLRDGQVIYL